MSGRRTRTDKMRSNARTAIATYCLLSVAGGVSFIMPDSLGLPMGGRFHL